MYINFPTDVTILPDVIAHAAEIISERHNNCLIITGGPKTRSTNLFMESLKQIQPRVKKCEVFGGITSNPEAETITQISNHVKSTEYDCVVTIGAGSVHDAGKLISVLATQNFSIEDLTVENAGYEKIKKNTLPVYTFPLLAGTGAEISPASLIKLNGQKRIVFSPEMYPKWAFYSLNHMFTDDQNLNLLTAFDAFIQSLEAYLSTKSNGWSDMFATSGLQNSLEGMISFSVDSNSEAARRQLVLAAIQGLLAVANSSVGAIHALSDPLSGRYNIHHGTALALVAAQVLKVNVKEVNPRYELPTALLNRVLGTRMNADSLPELVNMLVDMVAPNWRNEIGRLNIIEDMLILVRDSHNPDMEGNPRLLYDEDIRSIFSLVDLESSAA